MFKNRLLSVLPWFLLLTGCVTTNIPQNYQLSPDRGTGLVVVSVSQRGVGGCLRYNIRGVGNQTETFVMSCAPHGKPDWSSPLGRLVAIELNAGQYEFYRWSEHSVGTAAKARDYFSAPFEVIPGRAVYIGSLHIDVEVEHGRYSVSLADQSGRDLALFAQRYPMIERQSIDILISRIVRTDK